MTSIRSTLFINQLLEKVFDLDEVRFILGIGGALLYLRFRGMVGKNA